MIAADFFRSKSDRLLGFKVTGHAGLADNGHDIACASVSSAVMMAANTITEAFKVDAEVNVNENEISLRLISDDEEYGDRVILGLLTHLYFLSDEFQGCIKVKVMEE
ncbi:MAG: ribosomal-processing cysteine protease Prp [Oscillospiraceae bacterium]